MKVTSVSIIPTDSAAAAGRPALTPELLAASGARYSRNNQGLEDILAKIDPQDLDKSVDSIFRMIDYGHQSIADMAPVAMFIDDVSILLAYHIWAWCPTAGGQESSTRYVRLNPTGLVDPSLLGVADADRIGWYDFMDDCFKQYAAAVDLWNSVATQDPAVTRIPRKVLEDSSDRGRRKVARMQRNFAFDRARYFLPVAAKTNVMLVMSARAWTHLCQNLLSHWLPEAGRLGVLIRDELHHNAPRMTKHATQKESFLNGHRRALDTLRDASRNYDEPVGEAACVAAVEVFRPPGVTEPDIVDALTYHYNRYDFFGSAAARSVVRFGWSAVTLGEIRDLNRHRTGSKYCPLAVRGFYCAEDQLPQSVTLGGQAKATGDRSSREAWERLGAGSDDFAAWLLLGSQCSFEHVTTLDKFVYEAELRTGPGAHYRYATHLRDAVECLGEDYPYLAAAIKLGESEPE